MAFQWALVWHMIAADPDSLHPSSQWKVTTEPTEVANESLSKCVSVTWTPGHWATHTHTHIHTHTHTHQVNYKTVTVTMFGARSWTAIAELNRLVKLSLTWTCRFVYAIYKRLSSEWGGFINFGKLQLILSLCKCVPGSTLTSAVTVSKLAQ